jgi:hypothetical protein
VSITKAITYRTENLHNVGEKVTKKFVKEERVDENSFFCYFTFFVLYFMMLL